MTVCINCKCFNACRFCIKRKPNKIIKKLQNVNVIIKILYFIIFLYTSYITRFC